ncbi:bifunctional diguanylate cyclase/phosphodiesterase [Sphingosinicella sp. LHD-64]|uniref:putative bifunctional diguanylate cyclase/phosphodiesterase n=1 Tax=Sphingosinicella sp. LHD-64 TaxID=3072139 RepID=UPI00280DD90E|nr:bifunctional diguanylate cyclase/phosphodiesterase [Sphingosinicella sp. LHD-64]MDQ8755312.1 bifunctional diguanylate cyclase/phosphodiesterase [Sphingosinicella sp. LHD-64]
MAVVVTGLSWPVAGCVLVSAIALGLLYRTLRPVAQAAHLIRTARADLSPNADSDGAALLLGVRRLLGQLDTLEHRWVRRHAITGLPIRESLVERIEAYLAAQPGSTLVGAIRFNDYKRLAAFDPDAAETALKRFAERLSCSLGRGRMLAHVDRDCFAILFEAVEPAAAQREMTALCYALEIEIDADSIVFTPEVAAGAAVYPEDATNAAALVNHALISLTRMGSAARDRVRPHSSDDARERFTIEQGLRLAVERHELELNFQPVVDIARGLLVGAEALLRWRHPDIGMIEPIRFIPILEDSDLTRQIGLWTLNEACHAARSWRRRRLGDLKVAVNLSARQLRDADLASAIERILARHGLPPEALELELTETAAAEDAGRTRQLFGTLRTLGVTIAIDDFGSGYSSLSYLKNLPFDKLKIDREFVHDVDRRRDSQAICRSLIELSRGLGIGVLAEGAETLEEVETLQKLGCSLFQGFYFSKPLSADDFVLYAQHPNGRAHGNDARGRQRQLQQRVGT